MAASAVNGGSHDSSNGFNKHGISIPTVYASQGDKLHLHRPLTFFRRVRGFACLACLLLTSFMLLTFLSPTVHYLPRFFSVHYSRRGTSFFIGSWLALWPFLFEIVNETKVWYLQICKKRSELIKLAIESYEARDGFFKVIFAGDVVPSEDRVMLMCNHRTEVDWMYIWNLAFRKGKLGYCKYAVKSSVKNLPLFGWAFYVFEFLMLDRKWEVDESTIKSYLDSFQDQRDPLWLVIFPEGTDFSEEKRDKGNVYARENFGTPELFNVLQPRTRGFVTCLSQLRDSLDAVYDLTIGYKERCPLFINNLYGTDPSEVHMHIRRIPTSEIPESEEEMNKWLFELFHQKDQMLASFSETGSFPNSDIGEKPLNAAMGLSIFLLQLIPSLWLLWWLYKSFWVKVYVCVASLGLALSTYYSWRPSPCLLSKRKKL